MKKLEKICPKCGVTAKGKGKVRTVFGFRQMDVERPQSYCMKCRSAQKKIVKKIVKKKVKRKGVKK